MRVSARRQRAQLDRADPASDETSSSSAGVAWSCVHCGHQHDEQLPYCEMCARIRRDHAADSACADPGKNPRPAAFALPSKARLGARTTGGKSEHSPVLPHATPGSTPTPAWFGGIPRPREHSHASRCANVRREPPPRAHPTSAAPPPPPPSGMPPRAASANADARASSSDEESEVPSWHAEQYGNRWRAFQQEQQEAEAARREEAAAAEARRRHATPSSASSAGAASARARLQEHAREWERFVSLAKEREIVMADVPWPSLDAASLGLDSRYSSLAERRLAYRTASLRWHPDKFLQSFGAQLVITERIEVLKRVTEVSQTINSIYQSQAER